MRTLARVELLIRLAYKNGNPFEGAAAWAKALKLMAENGLSASDLAQDVRTMYCALSGTADDGSSRSSWLRYQTCPQCGARFPVQNRQHAPFCSNACRMVWDMRHADHKARRGVKRVHTVHQAGIVRKVEDKDWADQECSRCHKVYHYMTYPGNPRRYCEECREYTRREYDKERKRAARALRAAQKAQA